MALITKSKRQLTVLVMVVAMSVSQFVNAQAISGYVYTRGLITNDNGEPYWVEYDFNTGEMLENSSLGAASGDWSTDNLTQMSGATYRQYVQQYEALVAQYSNVTGADTSLMKLSRDEFESTNFKLLDGTAIDLTGRISLLENTLYVVVAPPAQFDNGDYVYLSSDISQIFLAQMPIDPDNIIGFASRSLLIRNEDGFVMHETQNTIGFRTALYSKPGELKQSDGIFRSGNNEDSIWSPLRNAKVSVNFTNGATDHEGRYSVPVEPLACLPDGPNAFVSAELYFQAFNPNNQSGIYPYFVGKQVPLPCFNINFQSVGFGLGFWYPGAILPTPSHYNDLKVDFSVINGQARLVNSGFISAGTGASSIGAGGHYNSDVTVEDATTYTTSDYVPALGSLTEKLSDSANASASYDFDRDGEADSVYIGRIETDSSTGVTTFNTDKDNIPQDEWVQGVYLSSSEASPQNGDLPNVTRLPDYNLSLKHEGLVGSISEEDLKNTDIYLVRMSNGELMAERTGATLAASGNTSQGVGVKDDKFHYTIHLRGQKQGIYKVGRFSTLRSDTNYQQVSRDEAFASWQAASGINPKFHTRSADLLRPGERVKLVAINRATGYIGTVVTTLDGRDDPEAQAASGYEALLSKMIKEIEMRPPNLKIWAERSYRIEQGLTASSELQKSLIGNEGAALDGDQNINLITQWLDHDGSPLPEVLKDFGYTGRVARVVAPNTVNTLAGTDAIFAIEPGTHLEVVQVENMNLSNDHLYIQVSGEPINRSPSFAADGLSQEVSDQDKFQADGVHSGIIQYRPNKFVPFQVRVWDEGSTLAQELAYNVALKDNPDLQIPKPQPVYHWLYRPEYQYSVYDLQPSAIERHFGDNLSQNILYLGSPVIHSTDNYLKIIFDIFGTEEQALSSFSYGGSKTDQLVMALGETELSVSLGQDRQLIFDDLAQLNKLVPEDFLTLRLYSNNDTKNTLWEWAFSIIEFVNIDDEPVELGQSFSHPRPVVEVGKNSDIDEFSITDISISNGVGEYPIASLTIHGRVFCDLADVLTDEQADITKANIIVPGTGNDLDGDYQYYEVDVSKLPETHEDVVSMDEYLPNPDVAIQDQTHTFIGVFSQQVSFPIRNPSAQISIEVENAINNFGYDSILVDFDLTFTEDGDITSAFVVGINNINSSDRGLFVPIWAKITDGSINDDNLGEARVDFRTDDNDTVSFAIVKNEDTGHLYSDRAIVALAKPFKESALDPDNAIYVFDAASETQVAYYSPTDASTNPTPNFTGALASAKTAIQWGYTAASPPNYYTYSEGTEIGINWYSRIVEKSEFEILSAEVVEQILVEEPHSVVPFLSHFQRRWVTDDHVEVVGNLNSGNELNDPGRRFTQKGRRFGIKLKKGAKEHPKKCLRVKTRYRDDDNELRKHEIRVSCFKADTMKTIVLAVDGLAYEAAIETVDHVRQDGTKGAFATIFAPEKTLNRNNPALASLPTITWANWPGVFGGGAPREHGVLGNSYFPRDIVDDIPVFSGGKSVRDKIFQQAKVALAGGMNNLAKQSAGSMYDSLADAWVRDSGRKLGVYSVRPFYWRHAVDKVQMTRTHFPVSPTTNGHSWTAASALDDTTDSFWNAGSETWSQRQEYSLTSRAIRDLTRKATGFGGTFENIPRGAGPEAALAWVATDKSTLDVMSIYFPGPDNVGHGIGNIPETNRVIGASPVGFELDGNNFVAHNVQSPVNSIAVQAKNSTDQGLSKLWDRINEEGYSNAVIFALTADHGQHQFFGLDHNEWPEPDLDDPSNNDSRVSRALTFNIVTKDIENALERPADEGGLNAEVWVRGEDIEDAEIVFSGNGGVGQFYVNSISKNWREPPSGEATIRLAEYLNAVNMASPSIVDDNGISENNPIFNTKISPKIDGYKTDGAFGSPSAIFARTRYIDFDNDGLILDDNCPWVSNPNQEDQNGNGIGDLCEPDQDGDGVPDFEDTCPLTFDSLNNDSDGDGVGDQCIGRDFDGDSILDSFDNCPKHPNVDQVDEYPVNGIGDVCDDFEFLPAESGFDLPYQWIDVEYYTDASGNTVYQANRFTPRVKRINFRDPNDFLDARRVFLQSQRTEVLSAGGEFKWPSFKKRLQEMSDIRSGDVIVVTDGRRGYLTLNHTGDSYRGWHGGPTVSESYVPLMLSTPGDSFVKINNGSLIPVGVPDRVKLGYQDIPQPDEEGYLRNWHLTALLRAVLAKVNE